MTWGVTTCAVLRGGQAGATVSAPSDAAIERDGLRLFSGLCAHLEQG